MSACKPGFPFTETRDAVRAQNDHITHRIVNQTCLRVAWLLRLGLLREKLGSSFDNKYSSTIEGATPTKAKLVGSNCAALSDCTALSESLLSRTHVSCWLFSIFSMPSMAKSTSTCL